MAYTIKSLAKKFGHSEVYIRRMITQGKLLTTKEKIAKNTYRHIISTSDYNAWRASTVTRSKRVDNRNKFTIYLSPVEFKKLDTLLEAKMPKVQKLLIRTNQKS